ncbi:hypothetical protein [Brevibacillus agri]|nr:hypothetical protein M655_025545 [Brevibacillus sp. NSP2.1]
MAERFHEAGWSVAGCGRSAVALDPGGSIDTSMLRSCSPQEVAMTPASEVPMAIPRLFATYTMLNSSRRCSFQRKPMNA